jgi:excisionase family DNA binding protein
MDQTETRTQTGRGLLTVREVARRLSVSPDQVRRLARRGAIPKPLRLGGSVRWSEAELQRFIDGRCILEDPEAA